MMNFAVILGNLGNTCDRFLSTGYKDQPPKAVMFKQAASIEGVSGIELVGSWDITTQNVAEVKQQLQDNGLKLASIIPDHFSQKRWGLGAFTSRDPEIRQQAIAETKAMMDAAVELGGDLVNLWPGQDGYDYPFQGNFDEAWCWIVEGVRECANYRKDVRLALEYKPKEPRTHSYMARAADTLLMALDTGCPNVGVTIDTSHSFVGGENVAEAAALLLRYKKLFHMHFNDNYRAWDDDMIVGSVHLVEYVELLYWLSKLKYDGWYSMDQYPYREDGRAAINESVRFVDGVWKKMNAFGLQRFGALLEKGEATSVSATMREFMGLA
ncbi:MAG: sugar phosphate isomerase/epimerase [Chloroflexi bacterium]|nr:sugar phosphate isomerase/epimerase [Chloroflexota bacterium]